MRTPTIPLILLTAVLVGCTDDAPTAPTARPSASAARATANRVALPFHGTLEESHTVGYDPATNTALIHAEGTGTGTHLGRFTLVADVTFTPESAVGLERMTLTAADGSVLYASGTGQVVMRGDGPTHDTLELLTITGGTGRFAGATGSFVLQQFDAAETHSSFASFDGTISLVH